MTGHGTANFNRSARDEIKEKAAQMKIIRDEMKSLRARAKEERAAEQVGKASNKNLRNVLAYFKSEDQLDQAYTIIKAALQSDSIKARGTKLSWENYRAWLDLRKETRAKAKEAKAAAERGAEAEAVKKDKQAAGKK